MKPKPNIVKSNIILILLFPDCIAISPDVLGQTNVSSAPGNSANPKPQILNPKSVLPDTSRSTNYWWGKGKIFDGFDTAKEVISKRNSTSKTFINDDGSYTAVMSMAPVHYLNKQGEWSEIDSIASDNKSGGPGGTKTSTTYYPGSTPTTSWWTGMVQGDDYSCTDEWMYIASTDYPVIFRSWACFDISSLCSGSTVTAATLWMLDHHGVDDGIYIDIFRLDNAPAIPPVGTTVWPDIRDGAQYYNNYPWYNGESHDVPLGGTANADISAAVATGWFGVGLSSDQIGIGGPGWPSRFLMYGWSAGASRPHLTVTYTCPCTAPSITTQPASPASICPGSSATITGLVASGTAPLSYQWQYNSGSWNNVADGIPAGATYTGGTTTSLTVSGITVAGSYQYQCIVTNACGSATSNPATFTVNPNNTITLTSAAGTDNQTLCINTAITNITYSTTGATGATFTGLPAGVTGVWAANTVTISGTPTVSGTLTYTITLTGGCP